MGGGVTLKPPQNEQGQWALVGVQGGTAKARGLNVRTVSQGRRLFWVSLGAHLETLDLLGRGILEHPDQALVRG